MKFTPEVIAALQVLKDNAENDFERHRISVLEQDLTEPPKIEVVDDTHQKFQGINYYERKGHYISHRFLHRIFYEYYFGDIPEGYEIHHIDNNPKNNNIENLQMLTKKEHTKIHYLTKTGRFAHKVMTCDFCGKEFDAPYRGKNRFCSEKCRYSAHHIESKEVRICKYCGKSFLVQNYEKVQYCSCSCAQKDRYKDTWEEKICPVCGKKFSAKKKLNQKYCSKKCAHIYLSNQGHEIRTCLNCGQEFKALKSKPTKYCSKKCSATANAREKALHKITANLPDI